MADVKWIKITTDIFDDEKILLIESLPDSYAIITVWFKLLCLAGKQNNSGVFMMGKIAYTDKMLATIFRMKETTVTMALQTFEQFGMVEIIDGVITIPNWGKHQNLDQLENKKAYMTNYMREYRAKQKALTSGKPNCKTNSKANVRQAEVEEDKEEDKDIDIDKNIEVVEEVGMASAPAATSATILQTWQKCTSSKLTEKISEDLAILAEQHGSDKVINAINIAADRGKVNLGYIKGILNTSGYDKEKKKPIKKSPYDALMDIHSPSKPPKTAGEDENIRKRAEELQKRLG